MSNTFGVLGHQAVVTLTDAQIKSLNSTPIQLVPSPGANKIAIPSSMFIATNFAAGAYSPGLNAKFVIQTPGGWDWAAFDTFDDVLADAANNFAPLLIDQVLTDAYYVVQSAVVNQSLQAIMTVDDATGGNAANSMVVAINYIILNLLTGQFE